MTPDEYWLTIAESYREKSQEPCEDAISREAAINVADYIDYIGLAVEDVKKVTDAVVKELKCLPPVTPKQRTGHWIEHPEIETSAPEYIMFYECSKCGDKQCFCKSNIHRKHFCNNCGCRMVDPQESEE